MKNFPPPHRPHRQQGVALVLVLCFVVLITGLVVAYFSRTLTTRQLSSASTSATSADLLADSATDVILGGLKQEIADTTASTASTPPPNAPATVPTVYVPTQAKYAVPQRNPPAAAGSDPVPNLVRRSMRSDNLPAPGVASLASAASSATTSANGHSISTARWNRHYLVPTTAAAGGTISISASAPVADFTAPDWVFVTAEKGPVELSAPNQAASGTVTVTGRYAYAIYDEGGLLDINHTGYPSASTLAHIGAKPAPSYADLTQLGMTTTNVDNLLGWRSYATLQNTATFPGYQSQSASTAETAYYNLFVSNPRNLLQTPLTVWNNKTDQAFLSRQQLIAYYAATGLDPKSLQYLGTFNRSLNQPSYVPEATRPQVLPSAQGGNNAGDDASNPSTNITPNFLAARVVNPFTRYDGTQALAGEPLVKKRFPLNRLAWLTYRGPSYNRSTTDADMAALINNYGITADFLKQGTPENIKTYFGLQWDDTTKWTYVHGSSGTSGPILNINNPQKSIDVVRLTGIVAREPDFFELLKAAINPGSIAKTSLSPNVLNLPLANYHAAQDQYDLDDNLDRAILQIGANIIDQFDTDGFPTRINYNLGSPSAGKAVYGDENLPYLSRVRAGLLHLKEANPLETVVNPVDPVTGQAKPVIDTGVAALMNYPEIWNLHDWNTASLQQSVGVVGPTSFKIYAATNSYSPVLRQATVMTTWDDTAAFHDSNAADPSKSPGFADIYHFQFGGETRYLAESNTKMTFVIDPTSAVNEANFREPTLLFVPGVPSGSQLASKVLVPGAPVGDANSPGFDGLASDTQFFSTRAGGGLMSSASASQSGNGTLVAGQAYIGFYLGAQPLRFWWTDPNNPTNHTNAPAYQTQFGPRNDVVFTLACDDGSGNDNYIPYDTKELTTGGQPNSFVDSSIDACCGFNGTTTGPTTDSVQDPTNKNLDYGVRFYQTVDPRTSRFGMVDPWVKSTTYSIAPRKTYSGVTDPNNPQLGAMRTSREGVNAGESLNLLYLNDPSQPIWYNSNMGWHPYNVTGIPNAFRPGMLSQNDPHAFPDGVIAQNLSSDYTATGSFSPFFYSDPDGVIRRASGGNVDPGTGAPASTITGLPMAYPSAANDPNSSGTTASQMDSRPSILNRPFRSVAELGYVFSGTPWKNLDFFLPESGDSALLDVFCVTDNSDSNALTAGQVNLNTHQVPVLQAILAQAAKDQWNDANVIPGGASAQAQQLAQLLVKRTVTAPTSGPSASNGPQPLQNVSDLVGRWVRSSSLPTGGIDGKASCDGFATDLATFLDGAGADPQMHNIQRFGESAVRALSNAGQTRVWNLMFDIVAQTGRFGTQATTLDQFTVEGEQHYWVHVAIDRYTGQIVDKQVEVVKE